MSEKPELSPALTTATTTMELQRQIRKDYLQNHKTVYKRFKSRLNSSERGVLFALTEWGLLRQERDEQDGREPVSDGLVPHLTYPSMTSLMTLNKDFRELLSKTLTVKLDVHVGDEPKQGHGPEDLKVALQQSSGGFWQLPIQVDRLHVPVQRHDLLQKLEKMLPRIKWSHIKQVLLHMNLDFVHEFYYKNVDELGPLHTWEYLLDEDGTADEELSYVESLDFRLEQFTLLPEGLQLWDIHGLRTKLRNYSICWLHNLNILFPRLQRLELHCGNEFPRLIEVNDWV